MPVEERDGGRIPSRDGALINVPDLVRTLCELGGVEHLEDLGARGPLMASAGTDSLFHALFGRDSLRMAMDLLGDFPRVSRATLLVLASLQGVSTSRRSEEEPGRILHEHREADDRHAIRLRKHWDFPYYGAINSTVQWINLLTSYVRLYDAEILDEILTDRLGRRIRIRNSLLAAVGWLARRLDDPEGGGYLWAKRLSPDSNRSQVWEDSSNAFHKADGSLLDPLRPFAPVCVQGDAYDALMNAADLVTSAGFIGGTDDTVSVDRLRERAARLQQQVLANFWQPDLRTFAHALVLEGNGSATPVQIAASGPGHLLATGLLDGPGAGQMPTLLVARLGEPDLLAAAGIRTKATGDPLFAPGSYHNGSVWPMDTGVIADGFRRHGFTDRADDLETRLLRACATVGGFPEFFRGDVDDGLRVNTRDVPYVRDGEVHFREQRPQPQQGWTATRIWQILRRRGAVSVAGLGA